MQSRTQRGQAPGHGESPVSGSADEPESVWRNGGDQGVVRGDPRDEGACKRADLVLRRREAASKDESRNQPSRNARFPLRFASATSAA